MLKITAQAIALVVIFCPENYRCVIFVDLAQDVVVTL